MSDERSDSAQKRLREAARLERRMLRDEAAAERRLLQARSRLERAEARLEEAKARVERRATRVEDAAESLLALQTKRATTSHRPDIEVGENAGVGDEEAPAAAVDAEESAVENADKD